MTAEQKKQAFLGSIEEKKARLAQLSEEYERIMQEKMPVRLLKAFPNAQSERYNEALEKSARKSAPSEKERLGTNKRAPGSKRQRSFAVRGRDLPNRSKKSGGKGLQRMAVPVCPVCVHHRLHTDIDCSWRRFDLADFSHNKKPWLLPWLF